MCIRINLTTTPYNNNNNKTGFSAAVAGATNPQNVALVRGKDRLQLVTLDLAGREKKKEIALEKLCLSQDKGTKWRIWLQQRENGEKWWVLRERKENPELWQEILSKIQ